MMSSGTLSSFCINIHNIMYSTMSPFTDCPPKSSLPPCRWLNKSWELRLWRGRICEQTPLGMGFPCRLGALWCTAVETGSPELCSLVCRQTGSEASGFLSPPDPHWQKWWWWRGRRSRPLCGKERENKWIRETDKNRKIAVKWELNGYADCCQCGSERPDRHSLCFYASCLQSLKKIQKFDKYRLQRWWKRSQNTTTGEGQAKLVHRRPKLRIRALSGPMTEEYWCKS